MYFLHTSDLSFKRKTLNHSLDSSKKIGKKKYRNCSLLAFLKRTIFGPKYHTSNGRTGTGKTAILAVLET